MATNPPTTVGNPPDPQATSTRSQTAGNVSLATFRQRDPAGYAAYETYRAQTEQALYEKYNAEEIANFGVNASATGPRQDAAREASAAANQRFAQQIVASGSGTLTTTTTPLLPQQPQPPSAPTAPVTPASNSQVPAAATPAATPAAIPTAVAPATNPQVAFTDPAGTGDAAAIVAAVPPAAVAPATNPQVPKTPTAAPPKPIPAPAPVNPAVNPQVAPVSYDSFGNPTPAGSPAAKSADVSAAQAAANQTASGANNANLQGQIQTQSNQDNAGDWRVKLRLAPSANYLYKAKDPGILQALAVTNGVIFPYTPKITTSYTATYNPYDLTHSNVRGYFYQGSHVGEVKLTAIFTAQDTSEANYLLAVIHFFRSVTKMFYGQDQQYRGSPPPLVFLQGLGEYQFSNHPCVVSQFDYVLPDDVDYIRARSVTVSGTDLLQRRARSGNGFGADSTSAGRLDAAGLTTGGLYIPPAPPTLGTNSPTYVPTKMEIAITLLPIQTRAQVSQQFSLEKFGNGNLQKGGFW